MILVEALVIGKVMIIIYVVRFRAFISAVSFCLSIILIEPIFNEKFRISYVK